MDEERLSVIADEVNEPWHGPRQLGALLCEAKSLLPYGMFNTWLRRHWPHDRATAWRHMEAARAVTEFADLQIDSQKNLAAVARTSLPKVERDFLLGAVAAGEDVTPVASKEAPKAKTRAHAGPSSESLAGGLARAGVVIIEYDEEAELFRVASAEGVGEGYDVKTACLDALKPRETHRECAKCGESKPIEAFSRHRKGRGGINISCKQCESRRATKAKRKRRAGRKTTA